MSADAVLRLERVTAGYGGRAALRDVDLAVAAGTRVALVGPNGSGKSTLFRVALGVLAPWSGRVTVLGGPPGRRATVAYVPQARALDPGFPATVRDVVRMGRPGPRLGPARAADHAAIEAAIADVGLGSLTDVPFGRLSGGQQQRALLARALAAGARLLCLDEPATGLDVATRDALEAIVARVVGAGAAALVSTHDLAPEHLARFDRVVRLADGAVVADEGPAA